MHQTGNDNRLSGFEAPSSIVSVYLGKELTDVFEKIVKDKENKIKLGKDMLPLSNLNITDRNRTSPFAFLGNRFEFRMPGSSSSINVCNTVLNSIMAEALANIANRLENSNDFYTDLKSVIISLYKKHSRIIYNGNSYSEEWEKEAAKRGLKNIKNAPEAFKAFLAKESIDMFEEFNVYSENELISRYNIKMEKYIKAVTTEAKVMIEIAKKDIMPQVIKYMMFMQNGLDNIKTIDFLQENIKTVSDLVNELNNKINILKNNLDKVNEITTVDEKGKECSSVLKDNMKELRKVVDTLEEILPTEYWPMPTYSDLLD